MKTTTAVTTGAFLTVAGGLLLAEQFDLLDDVRWRTLFAIALILLGVVILVGGRPDRRDRLPGS